MVKPQLPTDYSGKTLQALKLGATTVVDGSGASAQSTASAGVEVIRVVCDADAYLKMGATPTATTSDALLPAGTVEYFHLHEGEKLAILGAKAYITRMQ